MFRPNKRNWGGAASSWCCKANSRKRPDLLGVFQEGLLAAGILLSGTIKACRLHLQLQSPTITAPKTHTSNKMNPLVILPLLVAAAFGAPTGIAVAPLAAHPFAYAAAPLAYAAPVAYTAPIETRVHYADVPTVTGYSQQIVKPAIASAAFAAPALPVVAAADATVVAAKAEKIEVPAPVISYAAPLAYSAPIAVDLKAPVPAGDAPSMDELVTKEKVYAPVRAVSNITPQVTVQLSPKINVERVPVEVNVPHAVPVPVHTPVFAAAHAPAAYVVATH